MERDGRKREIVIIVTILYEGRVIGCAFKYINQLWNKRSKIVQTQVTNTLN